MKEKKTIVSVAWFKASHGGNFIEQMKELRLAIEKDFQYSFLLVLPQEAINKKWYSELLEQKMNIITIPMKQSTKNRIKIFEKIIEDYNVILIHNHFGMIEKELICACNRKKCKYVEHIRTEVQETNKLWKKIKKIFKYKILYSKSYIIVLQKEFENRLINYGLSKKRIYTIPDGINFKRVDCNISRKELRNKFGIPQDSYCFIMMGYDIYIKGIDIVVKAIQKVREKNYNIVLAIIMSSNKEKNILEISKWYDGKFPDWIIVLDANQNVGEYYKLSNAFISASRTEGFSNALAEAIYSELPAIISDIKGTSWASEFLSTKTYNTVSISDLALNIEDLIINPINKEIIGKAKKKIEKKYTMEEWTDKILDLYKKIL